MAGFTGHSTGGIVAGLGISICSIELFHFPPSEALVIGMVCYLGALFPDIDANKSVITRKFFRYFGVIFGMICSAVLFRRIEYYHIIGLIFGSWLLSFYVVRPIFNRITNHRGLFHSVPAGLVISGIFGNLILLMNDYKRNLHINKRFDQEFIFWISISFFAGYIVHLLMDEAWSLKGMKKSLGTALKFFEIKKTSSYLLMYLLACILYISIL
ncbi:MAG: metal-dependent hydrolase [Cytophagales bacterium]|nr:metal-dependent hydrolase [Cytophagales bacterium]